MSFLEICLRSCYNKINLAIVIARGFKLINNIGSNLFGKERDLRVTNVSPRKMFILPSLFMYIVQTIWIEFWSCRFFFLIFNAQEVLRVLHPQRSPHQGDWRPRLPRAAPSRVRWCQALPANCCFRRRYWNLHLRARHNASKAERLKQCCTLHETMPRLWLCQPYDNEFGFFSKNNQS